MYRHYSHRTRLSFFDMDTKSKCSDFVLDHITTCIHSSRLRIMAVCLGHDTFQSDCVRTYIVAGEEKPGRPISLTLSPLLYAVIAL